MRLMVSVKDETDKVIWEYGIRPNGIGGGLSNTSFRANGVGSEIVLALLTAMDQATAEFVALASRPNDSATATNQSNP